MSATTIVVAPEYFSIFVSGAWRVNVPLQVNKLGILANRECIRVPCLYWNDGDTKVTLGTFAEVDPGTKPDFDDMLDTPRREVILSDAHSTELARKSVDTKRTRIRIWINHPTEPDEVTIAIG